MKVAIKLDPRDLAVEVEIDRNPCVLSVEEYVILANALEEAKERIREFIT